MDDDEIWEAEMSERKQGGRTRRLLVKVCMFRFYMSYRLPPTYMLCVLSTQRPANAPSFPKAASYLWSTCCGVADVNFRHSPAHSLLALVVLSLLNPLARRMFARSEPALFLSRTKMEKLSVSRIIRILAAAPSTTSTGSTYSPAVVITLA